MRFEAKTETDAVEQAARALKRSAADVKYRVVRDEKSFWGGRIVEIEVDEPVAEAPRVAAAVFDVESATVEPMVRSEKPANADLTPSGDQTRGAQTRRAVVAAGAFLAVAAVSVAGLFEYNFGDQEV